jgi:dihydropteroate synthase
MKLAKIINKINGNSKCKSRISAVHTPLDFKLDRKGYFLIKIDLKKKTIHAGHCSNRHVLKKEIIGKSAEEIYNTIIRKRMVSSLQHAAYLGSELTRAEYCLRSRKKYMQDEGRNY